MKYHNTKWSFCFVSTHPAASLDLRNSGTRTFCNKYRNVFSNVRCTSFQNCLDKWGKKIWLSPSSCYLARIALYRLQVVQTRADLQCAMQHYLHPGRQKSSCRFSCGTRERDVILQEAIISFTFLSSTHCFFPSLLTYIFSFPPFSVKAMHGNVA
jgi:hypothetical protein